MFEQLIINGDLARRFANCNRMKYTIGFYVELHNMRGSSLNFPLGKSLTNGIRCFISNIYQMYEIFGDIFASIFFSPTHISQNIYCDNL